MLRLFASQKKFDEFIGCLEELRNDRLALAKLIIESGNVNIIDRNGTSALMHAVFSDNQNIVLELIAAGAKVNAQNIDGLTALMFAAGKRDDFNCYSGNFQIAKMLIEAGADIYRRDKNGWTVLILSAISRNSELITMLLKQPHIDVDAKAKRGGLTALTCSCSTNHYVTSTALDYAIVESLVAAGADVNKKGISGMAPLHVLSREEHDFDTVCKIAAMLLEAGADPNQLDEHGDAPLSNAVCYGNLEYVKLLIHNGADVNERDKFGTLPIIRAESSPQNNMGNNTIVVSVLVEAGADTQEQSIISDKVASCSKCGLRVKRGYPCAYCAHWAMMYDQHNSF